MSGKYFPHYNDVNRSAEKCIRSIAEQGDHVSLSAIERALTREYGVSSINGVGLRRLEDLSCVREHAKLLDRVSTFAGVFVNVFSIATLDALEECLLEFSPGGPRRGWKALMLGPLEKIGAVREAFQVPSHVTKIRRISTADVVRHLQDYLSRNGLWSGVVDPRDFSSFLRRHLGVGDNEYLGVRVSSTILATQSFKKAHRDLESFKVKFRFELQAGLDQMRSQLIGRHSYNVGMDLKIRYCEMDSVSVITDVLRKYHLLMSAAAYKKLSKKERRLSQVLENFLEILDTRDDLSYIVVRKLLQTAICASKMESPGDVAKVLGIDASQLGGGSSADPRAGDAVSSTTSRPSPTVSDVTRKLVELTDRCVSQGSLTLTQLARIEEKLAEFFGFPDFSSLGFGSFLSFLTKQPEPKRVVEHLLGETLSILGGGGGGEGTRFSPSHENVLAFVRQCQVTSTQSPKIVEDALCEYYGLADAKALGFGPLDKLIAAAAADSSTDSVPSASDRVYYEKALCAKSSSYAGPLLNRARHAQEGQRLVGVMGAMTREKAIACLDSCPSLFDLEEWTQWSRVFEPQFGSLKEFLAKGQNQSKSEKSPIVALESQPGVLLKLPSESSPEAFGKAVELLDARVACGQLTHLVATSFGPSNAPLVLLANHTQAALQKAEAASSGTHASQPSSAIKFVFNCLQLLPFNIASATAAQVFVGPLGLVVGSSLSKQRILDLAKQPKQLSKLQHLGWLMGITEWSSTFSGRIEGESEPVLVQRQSVTRTQPAKFRRKNRSASESPFAPQPSKSSSDPFAPQPSRTAVASDDDDENDDLTLDLLDKDPLDSDDEEEEKAKMDSTKSDNASADVDPSASLSIQSCRDLIEEIRRNEFGIGVEMSEVAAKLLAVQQARLGRSLERLSKDLYTKDTHFVLELIQNADDNAYDRSVAPSLEFVLEADKILVRNNERGFNPDDVRAICDVGNSTKGRVKGGYIGQKGIGFKSVFKISSAPKIRSGAFSFGFDSTRGPVGYILPHWVEREATTEDDGWTTTFSLPVAQDRIAESKSRFLDIRSTLLLFLHKIIVLRVVDRVSGLIIDIKKEEEKIGDAHVVTLTQTTTETIASTAESTSTSKSTVESHRWLVAKKRLKVSDLPASRSARPTDRVLVTELALAFPVSRIRPDRREPLPVFSFLPLRSFGLEFVVQADFDVPSSREDLDADSPWNQWLLSHVPSLFVESLALFRAVTRNDAVAAVEKVIPFLPSSLVAEEPFLTVAKKILAGLRRSSWIPIRAEENDAESALPSLRLPCETAVATDPCVADVVDSGLLRRVFGLAFVDERVEKVLRSRSDIDVIAALGIQVLGLPHLLQIGPNVAEQGNAKRILGWLYSVSKMGFAEDARDNYLSESTVETIKGLPVIPLSDNRFVSFRDCASVYFPRVDAEMDEDCLIRELERDLETVAQDAIDDSGPGWHVRRLLKEVGVKEQKPKDIIADHILPTLADEEALKKKSRRTIVSYLVYLKDQWVKKIFNPCEGNFLDVVKIATNRGLTNPRQVAVHFGPELGNALDLVSAFPAYSWILVDPVYLEGTTSTFEISVWRDFFHLLGVRDFINVKEDSRIRTVKDILDSPDGEDFVSASPLLDISHDADEDVTIVDFRSPELDAILDSCVPQTGSPSVDARATTTLLFELLERDWTNSYAKFTEKTLTIGNNAIRLPSSFSHRLLDVEWIPTLFYKTVSGETVARECFMSARSGIFVRTTDVVTLCGDHVPYLAPGTSKIKHYSSEFCKFLDIASRVTPEKMVDLLKTWSSRVEIGKPREFSTSQAHILGVYNFLHQELPLKTFRELLFGGPAIFVPRQQKKLKEIVDGIFLGGREVCWKDPSKTFKKYRSILLSQPELDVPAKHALNEVYPLLNSKELFTQAGVSETPSVKEYLRMLQFVTKLSAPVVSLDVGLDVRHVFDALGFVLMQAKDSCLYDEDWFEVRDRFRDQLQTLVVIPTKRNLFVSLNERPFISDDPTLERIFGGTCHLVAGEDVVSETPSGVGFFLTELCQLATLSSRVTKKLKEAARSTFDSEKQRMWGKIVPFVQRYLLTHFRRFYEDIPEKDPRLVSLIRDLKVFSAEKLTVRFTLRREDDDEALERECEEKALWIDDSLLLNSSDVSDAETLMEMYRVVAGRICGFDAVVRKSLFLFLSELGPLTLSGDGARIEERYRLEEIPTEEAKWSSSEYDRCQSVVVPLVTPSGEREEGAVLELKVGVDELISDAASSVAAGSISTLAHRPAEGAAVVPSGTVASSSGVLPSVASEATYLDTLSEAGRIDDGDGASSVSSASQGAAAKDAPSQEPEDASCRTEASAVSRLLVAASISNASTERPYEDDMPPPNRPPPKRKLQRNSGDSETDSVHEKSARFEDIVEVGREDVGDETENRTLEEARRLYFSNSAWDYDLQRDVDYEHVGSGAALRLPETETLMRQKLDGGSLLRIGRWGEELVYKFLLGRMKRPDSGVVQVSWANKFGESGMPYDIVVRQESTGGVSEIVYVEVKATTSDERQVFEVSANEVKFAVDQGENYHLYRVFNCGDPDRVRVAKVVDVFAKLESKQIKLCMLI